MHLNPLYWSRVFVETFNGGAVANQKRGNFQIPRLNQSATFAAWCTNRVGGNVLVKLRFGFSTQDADTAVRGVDFRTLNATNESDFGSVAFIPGPGAGVVDAPGSGPLILPPVATILITTAAGTDLTYEVWASCMFAP